MFELFVEGRNTLKTRKNNYMSKYRIISRDLNKIYNEQFRVFFLLSLAKGAVGLTTLRSTQFNIYTSVSVNICVFFSKQRPEAGFTCVIPQPCARGYEEEILL